MEDPEYPGVGQRSFQTKSYVWGRRHQSRTEESIKRRTWKWIGYTLRKPENNITCSALEWNPQGFRSKVVRSKQVDSLYIKVNK